MKKFNSTQLKSLKPAEEYFYTVKYAKYKRVSPRRIDTIVIDMLKEVGIEVNANFACSRCMYDIYEQAANIYYNSLKNIKQDDNGSETTDRSTKRDNKPRNNKSTKTIKSGAKTAN